MTRVALLASLALAGAVIVEAQIFRAAIEAVQVDVLVTSGNRPIGGLTAADFELLDNGVPQRIDDVGIEEVPFSMLLVLDTSDSMTGSKLADLKTAATAAVNAMRTADRASLLTFSDVIAQPVGWRTKGADLTSTIDALGASGRTALFDAAFSGLSVRDPEPGRRALVLIFSDGVDTSSWLPAASAMDKASRTDAVVYAVVLAEGLPMNMDRTGMPARGGPVSARPSWLERPQRRLYFRSGVTLSPGATLFDQSSLLRELVERTGGEALVAQTSRQLRDAFQRIVMDFRTRYLLSYLPAGVEPTGWHRIDVKVKGRAATVKARRGYQR